MNSSIGKNIVILQETDSTNNYANRQLAGSEVKECTAFLAHYQTGGRGQLKNHWESEAGENLTFSIVLKPGFLEIREQFMISKVVTLGIYSVLKEIIDYVSIKWPNDIYVENKKIAGILIENSIMSGKIKNSIAGIGININQKKFKSGAPNPVSLFQLTNKKWDLFDLLNKILVEINRFYSKLKNGETEYINKLFEANMFRFEEEHVYKYGEEKFRGRIIGVNDIGQLLIRDKNEQTRQFHFKEVEFIL